MRVISAQTLIKLILTPQTELLPRVLSARSNQIEIYVQPKSDYSTEMVAPQTAPLP